MRTELLMTFLEVSRTLHFRVATENLFVTQAAVSARIKLLEEDLGVLLFDRANKRLKLTAEGHKLVKHANEILTMWQKVKQDVGVGDASSTQLFVGAMMSIWDMVLHDWLQKIHRNLDDVNLFTQTYSPLELRKQVQNRMVDIAFLFEPPFIDDIEAKKVATIPLKLVSTQAVNRIEELENWVMVDYGESINNQVLKDFGDALNTRHHMNQPRIAMNFILEAGGAAYLPNQMCFTELRKQKLYLVPESPTYYRDVYAIFLEKNHKKQIIEDALQLFPFIRG